MKYFILAVCLMLSAGCTVNTVRPAQYTGQGRQFLYNIANWQMEGRLAIHSAKDSWVANLSWRHRNGEEILSLSGPLGQGAIEIKISERLLSINRGDRVERYLDWTDEFVTQQLGVYVPVRALRYWVMGLPQVDVIALDEENGFSQLGWLVEFKQMQLVGKNNTSMPRKIVIANDSAKLKLIINQWVLND